MAAGISAFSYALPDGRLTHEELQLRFGAEEMDKLVKNTGILTRRVSLNGECASDHAARAARHLFESAEIDPGTIDFLLFATQMPDYLLPTTACILQHKLGVPRTAGALDINLGCSQYVYAQATAYALVQSGLAKRVLVMTGDTPSRIVNPLDRSVVPLFGDAGTAAIVEDLGDGAGFQHFAFGTDGSAFSSLIWPTSGMRERGSSKSDSTTKNAFGSTRTPNDLNMDGQAIFLFTLKTVPESLRNFLSQHETSVDDIDFFVFHQASQLIVDSIAKKLGLPKEKYNHIFQSRGNSGGSTVGIALHHAVADGKIKPGHKVVLSAFGVGLSWAHALLIWPDKTPPHFAIE